MGFGTEQERTERIEKELACLTGVQWVQFPPPRPFGKLRVCDSACRRELSQSKLNLMFFVYILRNPKGHLYVGVSHSPQSRLIRHESGDGAEFTKRNKNFSLVYSEKFSTLTEARRRERQIKGWRREKKENLIKFGKPEI